jgi:hypothetical protein
MCIAVQSKMATALDMQVRVDVQGLEAFTAHHVMRAVVKEMQ